MKLWKTIGIALSKTFKESRTKQAINTSLPFTPKKPQNYLNLTLPYLHQFLLIKETYVSGAHWTVRLKQTVMLSKHALTLSTLLLVLPFAM